MRGQKSDFDRECKAQTAATATGALLAAAHCTGICAQFFEGGASTLPDLCFGQLADSLATIEQFICACFPAVDIALCLGADTSSLANAETAGPMRDILADLPQDVNEVIFAAHEAARSALQQTATFLNDAFLPQRDSEMPLSAAVPDVERVRFTAACSGLAAVVASQTRLRRFANMNVACKALSRALARPALLAQASLDATAAAAALVDAVRTGGASLHAMLLSPTGPGPAATAAARKEVRLLRFALTHLAALARHAPGSFGGMLPALVDAFAQVRRASRPHSWPDVFPIA
jgi:hypothetical protein